MEIEVTIHHPMITSKSVAWGERNKELFMASQEAIRYAVQNHRQKEKLQGWLESGTPLRIEVEFHLGPRRFHPSDLDSLFSDLLNPLVEGACGPRPMGKPIPQIKDRLFWEATLSKVKVEKEGKILIRIEPC